MKFLNHLLDALIRIEELLACLVSMENNRQVAEGKKARLENYQQNFLDKQEVLQLLKISERQLYNLRKEEKLPYRMIKGKLYFKLSDIEKITRR